MTRQRRAQRLMRLVLRILSNVITGVLGAVIVATVILIITGRFSEDSMPSVLGRKVLTVISGSMEPAIMTGDVIIVEPLKPEEEIGEGDIITFWASDETSSSPMLVTHRVMGVIYVNDVPAAYVTKGDANNAPDLTPVTREQIVGRYRWRIPYYGYLTNFVRTPKGLVLLVVAPATALIGMELLKIVEAVQEARAARKKAQEASVDAQLPG